MTLLHPYVRRAARALGVAAIAIGAVAAPAAATEKAPDKCHHQAITVFGHRGASGYRPEHTLAAYALAISWAPTTSSRTWSPPRTVSWSPGTRTRSAARPTSPTTPSSRSARPPRPSTACRSPAGSPRTSPCASSRRCGPRSGCRTYAPATPRYDGRFEIPTFDEVLDLARPRAASAAGRSASPRRPSTRPTSLDRPAAGEAAPAFADARRAQPAARQGRHPVVRDRQPARPRAGDRRSARPADLAPPARRTTWWPPATPGRTPTSDAGRAADVAAYADWLGPDKT